MDRTLAINPLFRRAHRTCAAGDRSVTWRRLKRACAGARSPTRRARARAATDRRRGLRNAATIARCRRRIAERDRDVARPALVADAADRAAFGVAQELRFAPREQRRQLRAVEAVADFGEIRRCRRRPRSGSTGTRAGSRRSRRRDCRSARAAPPGCCPASSIVRYEMQRRASSSYGATIAPVGQTSMQAVHVPQCALTGRRDRAAAGRCRSRRGRNTSPMSRVSSSVCLPRQPRPDLRRERDFEHRRAVGEHAIAERADVVADAAREPREAARSTL